ncbi:MAG: MarR family transcriptional regulator [Clostridia bacterium]|nr:MarR family transcriptional regulator [Clostridia bacterium]
MVTDKEKVLVLDKALQKLTKEIGQRFAAILPDNITPNQFFILLHIASIENCKAADIAECMGVSPAAASNMIERLYKNNWIDRVRSEGDRRVVWLRISEKGEKLLKEIQEKKIEMFLTGLKNVSDKEMDFLIAVLNKILGKKE